MSGAWSWGAGAQCVVTEQWVRHSLRCGRLQRCLAVSADAARCLDVRHRCLGTEVRSGRECILLPALSFSRHHVHLQRRANPKELDSTQGAGTLQQNVSPGPVPHSCPDHAGLSGHARLSACAGRPHPAKPCRRRRRRRPRSAPAAAARGAHAWHAGAACGAAGGAA